MPLKRSQVHPDRGGELEKFGALAFVVECVGWGEYIMS